MPIAIGDIHGCLASLRALVAKLPADQELIFLGDYVDRGPDSAGVIRYLRQLATERPCRFLMGNHERLMLDAIDFDDAIRGWVQNGANPTLHSYGEDFARWPQSAQRGAFLAKDRAWVEGLALYHEDETTIYAHAGIDVRIADMRLQDEMTLLWIREKFFAHAAEWQGKEVIFGHTPTLRMGLPAKRIFQSGKFYGIDTGAVFGGYLTAIDSRTHELYQEPGLRAG
ncbi:MAG TPA: metallophosphoesterase family protein [bacterium]